MKAAKNLLILILASFIALPALSAPPKRAGGKKAKTKLVVNKKPGKSGLGTDFDFEDLSVNGKYQYSDEAIATVEDEKILDDLLGMRTHFKDRLKKETKRR